MASITFPDGSSTLTLTTAESGTTSRFNNWVPIPDSIGERGRGLGDGFLYQYRHRVDNMATLELPRISNTEEATLQLFRLYAESGGIFIVTTDDTESNQYPECQLAENSHVEFRLNRETLEYTLSMTILNVAASPGPLRCVYS